jgi:hypothetical protein
MPESPVFRHKVSVRIGPGYATDLPVGKLRFSQIFPALESHSGDSGLTGWSNSAIAR